MLFSNINEGLKMQNVPIVPLDPLLASHLHTVQNESHLPADQV